MPIFRVEITPEAERDIQAIAVYIRKDNLPAAIRIVSEIREQVIALEQFPNMGRPGRIDGTREMVLGGFPYIVICQVDANTAYVARVLHGAQQWPPIVEP